MASISVAGRSTRTQWALIGILLVSFALYLYGLGAQGLWMDEVITVQRSNMSLPDMLDDLLETRNHVPLYFVLMYPWQMGGSSEFWVRFPSVMWAVLGIAVVGRLALDLRGARASVLASLLLALSPLYNWHAQDARMYTMVAFWVIAATWAFLRAWRRGGWGWWVLCGLSVLAAAYTHLLAPIVFVAQAFLVILQRRRNPRGFSRWFLVVLPAAVLYGVWLIVLANSGGFATAYTGWIPAPTLVDIPLTYYVLTVGATAGWQNALTYVPLVVVLALTVWLVASARRLKWFTRWALNLVGVGIVVMPLLVWLASLRQSIYVDRYFLPLVPLLAVWVAIGLDLLWEQRRTVAWIGLALLLVGDIWSLSNLHFAPRYRRDDWRGAAALIRDRAQPQDALLAYAYRPFQHYDIGDLEPVDAWSIMEDPSAYQERTSEVVEGKERLWLVLPLTVLNNHGFCEERDELAVYWIDENPYVQWLQSAYGLLEEHRFTGVHLMLLYVGESK